MKNVPPVEPSKVDATWSFALAAIGLIVLFIWHGLLT